ncbi:MAG: hypothetical protein R3E03_07405 [Novosphingobium sp.]
MRAAPPQRGCCAKERRDTLPALAQQQAERGRRTQIPACLRQPCGQPGNRRGEGHRSADSLLAGACSAGDDDGCRIRANTLFYTRGDPASRAEALKLFGIGL